MIETADLIGALRTTLGKLETVLDAIYEAIAWTSDEGTVQWCNTPLAQLVGQQRSAVLGAPLIDLLPLMRQGLAVPPESHPVRLTLRTSSRVVETYEFRRGDKRLYL